MNIEYFIFLMDAKGRQKFRHSTYEEKPFIILINFSIKIENHRIFFSKINVGGRQTGRENVYKEPVLANVRVSFNNLHYVLTLRIQIKLTITKTNA